MIKREYKKRRKQLMELMGPNSIAILPAAPEQIRNRDIEFPFRQDSDLLYLTGFAEPESVAVLMPGYPHGEFILFCRERDAKKEQWTGKRAGQEGACEEYKADDSFPIEDIDDILPGLMEHCQYVYYAMGVYPNFDQRFLEWMGSLRSKARAGISMPTDILALDHFLHELRLFKSRSEMKAMRTAASISSMAHRRCMEICRPGIKEYQLEAELLHGFMQYEVRSPAYPSIVAAGANACILHYTSNCDEVKDGDLVLIDAGAEYQGYAADITRTFPANGTFSPAQRELYEIVLAAQEAAIAKAKPGNCWDDPHKAAVRTITRGLLEIGLLKGRLAKLIKEKAYQPFFMHRTGHWLGLDVHDVGDYKIEEEWRLLEPGMVLTVEPGIYIPAGSKGVAKRWWDIGIRIEDDVLITEQGNEVISHEVPKTVAAIESLMAQSKLS